MIVEANRIWSSWFSNTTNGVNALLASTPLDGSDTIPAVLATITNECDDGNVARGEPPATLPALAVSLDVIEDLDGEVAQVTRDGTVKLRFRVTVTNADTAKATRDLSYYLRTVLRSARKLLDDLQQAARTRNGVYLENCLDMKEAIVPSKPATDEASSSTLSGYVLATMRLRDLNP